MTTTDSTASTTRKYATAAMSTLTLSRVMIPCDWMGMVTMRIEIRHRRSMIGMMNRNPGSRTPITRPSRKCTPRWYCCTIRIEALNNSTATRTATTIAITALEPMITAPNTFSTDNARSTGALSQQPQVPVCMAKRPFPDAGRRPDCAHGCDLTKSTTMPTVSPLTRQPEKSLGGDREQDLLGTAGDRQAAGVEEVEHRVTLDEAAAFGYVHHEFGQRLPVADADEFAHAGLRARVLAANSQLGDALVQQRTG